MMHEVELWNNYVKAKKAAIDKNSDSVEGQAEKIAWIDWLEATTEEAQND
jgi:hypothetical protein